MSSWSTTERFTTQVIYESKTNRYAAVFNESQIKVWNEQDAKLDAIKPKKFNHPFNTLLSCDDGTIIVVRYDGATASLQWALDNRKTWKDTGFLRPNEKLSDCRLITIKNKTYLCGLIRTDTTCTYVTIGLHDDTYLIDYETIKKIELKRISEQLVGHVVIVNNNNAYLLTLWSHGRLYSYQLIVKTNDKTPGTLISVFSSISTKNQVLMVALNESTIAAYGANVHEEGAVLLIYNIPFKFVQAVESLKLYIKDAKLWRIDDKLLLAENQHLRLASYCLASQRIETMLGSSMRFKDDGKKEKYDSDIVEIQETIVANWQDSKNSSPKQLSMVGVPKKIAKQINVYLNEGVCDAVIQKSIIPELIKGKDISTILWCLDNLKDQPEKIIADLLSFSLRTSDDTFKQIKQQPQQNGTPNKKNKSITRNDFLDKLFKTNFYDLSLLNYLKSELTFNEVLRLMNYIIDKFNNQHDTCQFGPNDKQLYEWASLLLDSHYQHYLLSHDPTVSSMLSNLEEILCDHVSL